MISSAMDRQHTMNTFISLAILFPLTSGLPQQSTPTLPDSPFSSLPPIATPTSTSDPDDPTPLDANYYYVSVALIVCVAAVAGFFFWRRRKQLATTIRHSRESALRRDVHSWDPARPRRRYWNGRYRMDDAGREEGLDERGEAPPPYVPKSQPADGGAHQDMNEPAIPLQTLSRENAGLKPPDYTVTETLPLDDRRSSSVSAGSSSRPR